LTTVGGDEDENIKKVALFENMGIYRQRALRNLLITLLNAFNRLYAKK
jgi:hypothetical protein